MVSVSSNGFYLFIWRQLAWIVFLAQSSVLIFLTKLIVFSHNIGQDIIEYLNSPEKITSNENVNDAFVLTTSRNTIW